MNFIKSSTALAVTATLASSGAMAQDKPKASSRFRSSRRSAAAAPKLDGVADDAVLEIGGRRQFQGRQGRQLQGWQRRDVGGLVRPPTSATCSTCWSSTTIRHFRCNAARREEGRRHVEDG